MSKLDRLARSVPDARGIADQLLAREVKLALGPTTHDPTDPMGKMFFNILATFAEFETDLIRMRGRLETLGAIVEVQAEAMDADFGRYPRRGLIGNASPVCVEAPLG